MPIYEYRCSKCGDFDVMQKITEKPLRKCPTCKGKVSKLMSNTAFQLKGTGWYITDYAAKGKTPADAKEESTATPAEKPAATADAPAAGGDAGKSDKGSSKKKGGKGSKPAASAAA